LPRRTDLCSIIFRDNILSGNETKCSFWIENLIENPTLLKQFKTIDNLNERKVALNTVNTKIQDGLLLK